MVPVPPDTMSLEQVREPQARMHLVLGDEVVSILWLTNDEFAELDSLLATATQQEKHMKENIPATPYP
jgi:hypothetical protein